MLFKRNAISSLLLELDSDDLPQSKRGHLSNCLAQEVMDFIPSLDCATPLLNREKEIIEKRGRDPQKYLMGSDIGIREVLQRFYKSIYYDDEGKKQLVPDLTISELMIMLGVFDSILITRENENDGYVRKLRKIRKKTSKKYSYYVNKKNGLDELDDLFRQEESIKDSSYEVLALIDILSENMDLIEAEIYKALNTYEDKLSNKDIDRIEYLSSKLANSYSKIESDIKKRKQKEPTVFDDTLLLEYCGEDSERLFEVYDPNYQQSKLNKMLKYNKK